VTARVRSTVERRGVTRRRADRRAAADPATPIDRLVELGASWPRQVLSNPAWQLALVADPSLARRAPDAVLAESVKTAPLDDAACLRAFHAWMDRPSQLELTLFALASHAEAPYSWLCGVALHAPPGRCVENGLEIARHRAHLVPGEFHGWAAAILPSLRPSARSRWSVERMRSGEDALVELLHHGAFDLDNPFALIAGAFGSQSLRDHLLSFAQPRHARWMCASADVEAGYDPHHRRNAWRLCSQLWDGAADEVRKAERFGPCCMAEAMGMAIRLREARDLLAGWLDGEREPTRRARAGVPLDDAILEAACSGPVSSALLVLLSLPACPRALLAMHARDEEPCVRAAVASNPALPAALRARLAGDWHWIVRGAALGHDPWRCVRSDEAGAAVAPGRPGSAA